MSARTSKKVKVGFLCHFQPECHSSHTCISILILLLISAGKNVDSSVPSEPRWKTERREHYSYRPDTLAADPKKQSSIAVGWLTSDINNVQENFELAVCTEFALSLP